MSSDTLMTTVGGMVCTSASPQLSLWAMCDMRHVVHTGHTQPRQVLGTSNTRMVAEKLTIAEYIGERTCHAPRDAVNTGFGFLAYDDHIPDGLRILWSSTMETPHEAVSLIDPARQVAVQAMQNLKQPFAQDLRDASLASCGSCVEQSDSGFFCVPQDPRFLSSLH
jgi:hypothetical protein